MLIPEPVTVFFNFRSPYCYLASKTLFPLLDEFHVDLQWRPLGGWRGRSDPERVKVKRPVARQDVARFARCLGIPVTPPPDHTDPTRAAAGSLWAEEQGMLQVYVVEVMRAEWADGLDIGDLDVLSQVADSIGLDPAGLRTAVDDPARLARLDDNAREAEAKGAFGVPTVVIGDEIFWGQDRFEFVADHLRNLRKARL